MWPSLVELFICYLQNTLNSQLDTRRAESPESRNTTHQSEKTIISYPLILTSTAIGQSPFRGVEEPMSSPRKA